MTKAVTVRECLKVLSEADMVVGVPVEPWTGPGSRAVRGQLCARMTRAEDSLEAMRGATAQRARERIRLVRRRLEDELG